MAENQSVVTVGQLNTVATAQKNYIDAMDKKNDDAIKKEATDRDTAISTAKTELETSLDEAKTELTGKIEDVEKKLPSDATDEEIQGITDLFKVD